MKKFFSFFLLLFFSGLALADSAAGTAAFNAATTSSPGTPLNPAALSNYTDMSIYYLGQLFGTVGTALTGTSSQLMGRLFEQLNWGIFIISGIMVGYAVLLSTLRLASEGVTIAPGKSTLFTLIKLAIGVVCIIPLGGTGYSLLQELVMNVVVKGVGLADSIWSSGLQYLNEGGVVWTPPVTNPAAGGPCSQFASNPILYAICSHSPASGLMPNNTTSSATNGSYNPYTNIITPNAENKLLSSALGGKIFQNAVCMIGSRDPISAGDSGGSGAGISVSGQSRPYFNVTADDTNHVFNFPGINDSGSDGASCGSASYDINGACETGPTGCAIAKEAMSKLISSLMPAAGQYYCFKNANSPMCKGTTYFTDGVNQGLSPYLFNALINYYPTIQIWGKMQQDQVAAGSKAFINSAEQEGWMMAGRYYWDIMQITAQNEAAQDPSTYTTATVTDPTGLGSAPELSSIVQQAGSDFASAAGSSDFQSYIASVYAPAGQGQGTQPSGETTLNATNGGNLVPGGAYAAAIGATAVMPAVGAMLWDTLSNINDIASTFSDFSTEDHYNPIKFFHDLGVKCINATLEIWLVAGVAIFANMLVGAICTAMQPYAFAASAIIDWIKPIIMMIAIMLWAAGFFLTVYVPLYPYMIFLFASIGWFISVAEAMVAAPLVALGLAHPENHDLLGKAEQAVMLLLSVFIQPSLLVIGMLGGIILSYVAFQILIFTFSGFIIDMLGTPHNTMSMNNMLAAVQMSNLYSTIPILVQPLLLGLFCTITYTLLTQSFSLVYLLRDNVMRWIGAPATGLPSPDQLTQDSRSAVSGYGRQSGDAIGGVATNSKAIGDVVNEGTKMGKAAGQMSPQDGGDDSSGGGGGKGGGGSSSSSSATAGETGAEAGSSVPPEAAAMAL